MNANRSWFSVLVYPNLVGELLVPAQWQATCTWVRSTVDVDDDYASLGMVGNSLICDWLSIFQMYYFHFVPLNFLLGCSITDHWCLASLGCCFALVLHSCLLYYLDGISLTGSKKLLCTGLWRRFFCIVCTSMTPFCMHTSSCSALFSGACTSYIMQASFLFLEAVSE
jgi:hypothetical protein